MSRTTVYDFCINNEKMKYILDEWDYERNGDIKPEDIAISNPIRVNWICKYGHRWESSVHHRIYVETDCPYCAGKKIAPGFNDLATKCPELAKEWHPTKNELGPENYFPTSEQKVWWQCEKGHEWQAVIKSRALGRNGKITKCPFCSNKKVWVGYNDLATKYPEVAKEWNYEKNEITPQEVVWGSNKRVWWKCKYGHEWKMPVYRRTQDKPRRCPECRQLGL